MKLFKNGINVKWLLLIGIIIIGTGYAVATVDPIISNFHSYLDILHVNYLYGDISNTTGVIPNASIPLSALNKTSFYQGSTGDVLSAGANANIRKNNGSTPKFFSFTGSSDDLNNCFNVYVEETGATALTNVVAAHCQAVASESISLTWIVPQNYSYVLVYTAGTPTTAYYTNWTWR